MATSPAEVTPQRWLMVYHWTKFLVNLTKIKTGLEAAPEDSSLMDFGFYHFRKKFLPAYQPHPDLTEPGSNFSGKEVPPPLPHSAFKCQSSHRFTDTEHRSSWPPDPRWLTLTPQDSLTTDLPLKANFKKSDRSLKRSGGDGAATGFHVLTMILQTCPQAHKMAHFTTFSGLSLPPAPSWESPGLSCHKRHRWPLAKHLHPGPPGAAAFCQNP